MPYNYFSNSEADRKDLWYKMRLKTLLKITRKNKIRYMTVPYCSDFRNEINGLFVLGVGFFFRQISNF